MFFSFFLGAFSKSQDPSDVNAPGVPQLSCFGLISAYQRPLHKAVKDKDNDIMSLLLLFGADPMLKDSKGKSAYDYVKSPLVKAHIQKLHARTSGVCAFGWGVPALAEKFARVHVAKFLQIKELLVEMFKAS